MTVILPKILENPNFIESCDPWAYWRKEITNFKSMEYMYMVQSCTSYAEETYISYKGTVYSLFCHGGHLSTLSPYVQSPRQDGYYGHASFYNPGSVSRYIQFILEHIVNISTRMESFYK